MAYNAQQWEEALRRAVPVHGCSTNADTGRSQWIEAAQAYENAQKGGCWSDMV